uniref:Anterior gradient 2 n=1 Tax=Neolamprologus brichardi TaxID=32507 RepID=A0A3Q4HTQ0_NEOBR
MVKSALSVLLVLVAISSTFAAKYIPKSGKRVPQTLSRGWGDQLIWAQTYEEGLYWSRSKNKPLLVIFHLEDCPHSQALKKVFSEDNEVQKILDEDFVILNLVYETTDKHLSPDGQYVPRLLFVGKSSRLGHNLCYIDWELLLHLSVCFIALNPFNPVLCN